MSLVHSLSHLLLDHYSHLLLETSTLPPPSLFSARDCASYFTDKMTSIRREPPQTPPEHLYTTGICSQVLVSRQSPQVNFPCSKLEPFLPFMHWAPSPFHYSGHCSSSSLLSPPSSPPTPPPFFAPLHFTSLLPFAPKHQAHSCLRAFALTVSFLWKALLTDNHLHNT